MNVGETFTKISVEHFDCRFLFWVIWYYIWLYGTVYGYTAYGELLLEITVFPHCIFCYFANLE